MLFQYISRFAGVNLVVTAKCLKFLSKFLSEIKRPKFLASNINDILQRHYYPQVTNIYSAD